LLAWVFVLIALALGTMIILPETISETYPILILIAALGILYRIHSKKQEGKMETLETRIRKLEKKIDILQQENSKGTFEK